MSRILWAALVATALAACQAVPTQPTQNAAARGLWGQRQAELVAIRSFSLQGRVAGGGVLGGSGELSWQQVDDRIELLFSGALGVGAIHLEGSPEDFVVHTKDGDYRAEQAEVLLQERLGGELPLADLRYWILGVPRPGAAATIALDDAGRLSSLYQDGWHLDYIDYRASGPDGRDMPHRLSLGRDGSKWRVVVDRWIEMS